MRLFTSATTGHLHLRYLWRHLRAAHRLLKNPLTEVSLALVGDKRMSSLHQEFMDTPGPTDVLTFPLEIDSRGRVTSGEIVICVPEARRRAASMDTELRRELLLYAIHGLLHLCGYDDRTDVEFMKMHQKEDAILTRLGVGPVFSAGRDGLRRPARAGRSRRSAD